MLANIRWDLFYLQRETEAETMRRALRKASGTRILSTCVIMSVGLFSWTFGHADDSVLTQNVLAESAAHKEPETDFTAPTDGETQSTRREATTEELIAGRGFQKLRYKGLTFAPGGYIEAAGIFRSANENGDIQSNLGNIPLHGTTNSHLTEFRGTARGSRINLLGEGTYRGVNLSSYLEFDFLGAPPNGNEVETNSWDPRLRQIWANIDWPTGTSFLVGQSWSLLTTHRLGLQPRREFIPLTIDLQSVVGHNWARQWQIRLTKVLTPGVIAAVALENPETSVSGVVQPLDVQGFNTSPNAQSPSSFFTTSATPGANGISTDIAPDVLGKVVFEPGWGHWEIKGLLRVFRDRLNAENHVTVGGGAGVAVVLPIMPTLNIIAEGFVGKGIGRYASTVGADAVASLSGKVVPIAAFHFMMGLEWHPTTNWDVYAYYGLEQYARTAYSGTVIGYGSPLANLSGCGIENPGTLPCQAANMAVSQIHPGVWHRIIDTDIGVVAVGLSYSYTHRTIWSGLEGARPRGEEHMSLVSIRYYLP